MTVIYFDFVYKFNVVTFVSLYLFDLIGDVFDGVNFVVGCAGDTKAYVFR